MRNLRCIVFTLALVFGAAFSAFAQPQAPVVRTPTPRSLVAGQTFTIMWDANADLVTGYRVSIGTVSHVYTITADVPANVTQYQYTATANATYFVAVQALRNAEISNYSAEAHTASVPASPDCSFVPPLQTVVDDVGTTWSLGTSLTGPNNSFAIMAKPEGAASPSQIPNTYGRKIGWITGGLYIIGDDPTDIWYKWNGTTFTNVAAPAGCTVPPPCTYTLGSPASTIAANGGSTTVPVTVNISTCVSTTSTSQNWLQAAPASATGNFSATVTATANLNTAQRTADLIVSGVRRTITQLGSTAPPPCTFSISPPSGTIPAAGGTVTSPVVASDTTCNAAPTSNQPWMTVSPPTAVGNFVLAATATANTAPSVRSATATVGNASVVVTQAAATTSVCQTAIPAITIPSKGWDTRISKSADPGGSVQFSIRFTNPAVLGSTVPPPRRITTVEAQLQQNGVAIFKTFIQVQPTSDSLIKLTGLTYTGTTIGRYDLRVIATDESGCVGKTATTRNVDIQ